MPTVDAGAFRPFPFPRAFLRALGLIKEHAARVNHELGLLDDRIAMAIMDAAGELIEGRRIVQAWRASDWPTGVYSIVTFNLDMVKKGKTKLLFTQTGVPNSKHQGITQGWKDFYWRPMKLYFASKK